MQSLRCEGKDLIFKITNCIITRRNYATRTKNFYEVLGLRGNATAVDIKTAYYKLSMLYHPDKNENSEEAAEKFRQITEAYEVLGNFRLKKLYDKGIIHSANDNKYRNVTRDEPVEDDATTRFYKAREHRHKAPTATGRTPIYDFDEWTRNHYSATFNNEQDFKKRQEFRNERNTVGRAEIKAEMSMFASFAGLLIVVIVYTAYDKSKPDVPKEK